MLGNLGHVVEPWKFGVPWCCGKAVLKVQKNWNLTCSRKFKSRKDMCKSCDLIFFNITIQNHFHGHKSICQSAGTGLVSRRTWCTNENH